MAKQKQPSLDETYNPSEDDLKMKPYDRLQALFAEKDAGKLTPNANDKLDYLLGTETKQPFYKVIYEKISAFFGKIDSLIFAARGRKNNGTFNKRKKTTGKWS